MSKLNASPSSSSSAHSESKVQGAAGSEFIRINGRKVIGPPPDWIGPPPTIQSEVFVKHIPKDMSQVELLDIFRSFGPIYNFRLMVDFGDQNRGFGYVHFAHESDAEKCINVLKHRFLKPHRTLYLMKSYDKCRFFVSHLPTDQTDCAIRQALSDVFPEMSKVSVYGPNEREQRGFAFVEFPSHAAAIRAKKNTSTGRCRLFDRDVKVVWANPEPNVPPADVNNVRTLFVRNIAATVSTREIYELLVPTIVSREKVQRISRTRDLAFVDFFDRESAKRVKEKLDGFQLENRILEVFWGLPHKRLQEYVCVDYDASLRMKCVANNWFPPIYIFGRVFAQDRLQFVSVILEPRLGNNMKGCIIFMQITVQCMDLQSRVAEVAETIIEMHGQLPSNHYMLLVDRQSIHIVGKFSDLLTFAFEKAHTIIDDSLTIYMSEMYEMCQFVVMLLQMPHQLIAYHYATVISNCMNLPGYLPTSPQLDRCFGCIHQFVRQQPPLKYGLKCDPIVLSLCFTRTGGNVLESPSAAPLMRLMDVPDSPNTGNRRGLLYRRVTLSNLDLINTVMHDGAIYFPRPMAPIAASSDP